MESVQLEKLLVEQNPQWQKLGVWEEKLLLRRNLFFALQENLTKNHLVATISGTRRVGKSFLLKQLVAVLIRDKIVPPANTLYFMFRTSLNEKNIIGQVVDLFLSKYADPQKPVFIFLDEVQYLSYWPDQVKAIYDRELPIKFVITGSTSLFFGQKSKESLLGRMEKFSLAGLSFNEYLRFKNLPEAAVNRAEFMSRLSLFRTEFRHFLASGQLPQLVVETGIDTKKYLFDMVDQLVNFDVPYMYGKLDRTLFNNLFKSLSFSLANEFSSNKTAKELETTRGEISEYLRLLEEIGLFSVCLNAYFRKMRAKLSAVKKIYSLNTNLSLVVNGFDESYFNDSRVLGQYAEDYVFMRLKEKFGQKIEYYSDRKTEVDFVTANDVWEVKYGQIGDIQKYQSVAQKLHKKLTIVTESEWEEGEVAKLPIYLL